MADRHLFATLIALTFITAGPGVARASLAEDRIIDDGLTLVAIGRYLDKSCADIGPKYLKSYGFARSLQRRARELGYSDAEIEAFLDDDNEKARVKAQARAYLEAQGANFDEPATLCKVGRNEIANQTPVGKFLTIK